MSRLPLAQSRAHRTRKRCSCNLNIEIEEERRVVGETAGALVVRIADLAGASHEGWRQERVVDAEAVAARTVPGEFAAIGITPAPQIAKADLRHTVHKMRTRINPPAPTDISPAADDTP